MKYYIRTTFDKKVLASCIHESGSGVMKLGFLFSLVCYCDSGYPSYNFPREASHYKEDIDYNKVLEICKVKKWKI